MAALILAPVAAFAVLFPAWLFAPFLLGPSRLARAAGALLVLAFLPAFFPVEETHTDSAGAYALRVQGGLANGLFGARLFSIGVGQRVNRDPHDPDTTVDFTLMQTQVSVPPLQIWEGNGQAAAGSSEVVFTYDDLFARTGIQADDYDVEIEVGGQPFTTLHPGINTSARFPRLALQDFACEWRPLACATEHGSGTRFRLLYRGRTHALPALNARPPTRGCPAILTPPGTPLPALTDGGIGNALPQGATLPARIEVDLGAPRALSVVHLFGSGVSGSTQVTVSLAAAPGQVGTLVARRAQAGADPLEIPLPPGSSGRVLIVETAGGLTALGEIVAY